LSALADDPTASWAPARLLEQDAALINKLMTTATNPQRSDGQAPDVTPEDMGAALSLFEDMRRQLDKLETGVIVESRLRGLNWKQVAQYQGLKSSQAASQRYQRLMTRLEEIRQGVR
jgi:hypothetical protein